MQVFFEKQIERRFVMKKIYAKVILYAYPCCDSLTEQIDELVEKRALSSMYDFSPCENQCFKILTLTEQKRKIIALKNAVEKTLKKFGDTDRLILDYRYFKTLKKDGYGDYDFSDRKYFRRQNALLRLFAERIEKAGFSDLVFEEEYLSIDFSLEMKRREERRSLAYAKKNRFVKKIKNDDEPPIAAKKSGGKAAMSA